MPRATCQAAIYLLTPDVAIYILIYIIIRYYIKVLFSYDARMIYIHYLYV